MKIDENHYVISKKQKLRGKGKKFTKFIWQFPGTVIKQEFKPKKESKNVILITIVCILILIASHFYVY